MPVGEREATRAGALARPARKLCTDKNSGMMNIPISTGPDASTSRDGMASCDGAALPRSPTMTRLLSAVKVHSSPSPWAVSCREAAVGLDRRWEGTWVVGRHTSDLTDWRCTTLAATPKPNDPATSTHPPPLRHPAKLRPIPNARACQPNAFRDPPPRHHRAGRPSSHALIHFLLWREPPILASLGMDTSGQPHCPWDQLT